MKKVLAFDFGASSGRAILGIYENGKITLEEIHRFSNDPVRVNGHFYWDTLRQFHEIKQGIIKCVNAGHKDISSIGIDTWGVDYAFIDKNGELVGNSYHYRDIRTENMIEKVEQIVGKDYIYEETGIQTMSLNTIYQLASQEIPKNACKLLFTPDLFAYFLTGAMRCEHTIVSTSQLFNPKTHSMSKGILKKLGIDEGLFCPIIEAGDVYGNITEELSNELGIPQIPVIAVASHDTASAVAAVPFESKKGAYISCGTWSLLGVELDAPLITKESAALNFTNEGGFDRTIRFLKNIIGLWLVQECRNQWKREGEDTSFVVLDNETAEAEGFLSYVDPDHPSFLAPLNMPKAIAKYCVDTNQPVPMTKGQYLRTILQSLAMKYRSNIEDLEKLLGEKFDTINMVGGGIQDKLLCQFTANATNKTVIAGPVEATAGGNIMVQFISLGDIKTVEEGREIIKKSLPIKNYLPKDVEKWNAEYEKFLKL